MFPPAFGFGVFGLVAVVELGLPVELEGVTWGCGARVLYWSSGGALKEKEGKLFFDGIDCVFPVGSIELCNFTGVATELEVVLERPS
jgi:hypothetical protein